MQHRRWVEPACWLALVASLASCTGVAGEDRTAGPVAPTPSTALSTTQSPVTAPTRTAPVVRPAVQPDQASVVLVLMDDFSMDLLQTMRSARVMARRGASYQNAYVVDSLCCVSRASLLTGQYPHQTGVLTNTANTPNSYGPIGGWEAFDEYGNTGRSVNVRLAEAGYRTAFVGKFLNEYEPGRDIGEQAPKGWTDWHAVFGDAYDGWDFTVADPDPDGSFDVVRHEAPPESAPDEVKDAAYATTVIGDIALDFIDERRVDGAPYFLEIAPYGPHSRAGGDGHYADDPVFPPAFADRPGHGKPGGDCGLVACAELTVDDLAGYGDPVADNRPRWEDGRPAAGWRPSEPVRRDRAARTMRDRARMVASIDRMVMEVLAAVDDETFVILTSDNGFHYGHHGLGTSKGTPYDSDVHVPMLVVGPGVVPGARQQMVSSLDLAPTFEQLAGLDPARFRSGVSMLPSLTDPTASPREHVVMEHTWAPSLGGDPDRVYSGGVIDDIPSYVAVRSSTGLLVRFDLDHSWEGEDLAWEYYDYRASPFERRNAYADPAQAEEVERLRHVLDRFDRCSERVRDEAVPPRCKAL